MHQRRIAVRLVPPTAPTTLPGFITLVSVASFMPMRVDHFFEQSGHGRQGHAVGLHHGNRTLVGFTFEVPGLFLIQQSGRHGRENARNIAHHPVHGDADAQSLQQPSQ
jgi:hypothetical protein